MFKNVQRFYKFLSNRRKKQINFLFITLFFGGIFESFVIYISLPFIYIITNRNELNNIPYIGNLFNQMNIFESQEILKYTSIFFTLTIIISALFKLLNQWFMYRLSAAICSDYSTKIYWNIINTPYEDHIARNTSEIIANLNLQVEQALHPSIIIYFQIIFIITNIIFILGSLFIVNYWLAIISFSLLFIVYFFLSSTTKKRLLQNSKTVSASEIKLVKNVKEGLGFLKEIIMSGNAILFTKDFASTDRNKRYKQSEAQFIFSSPNIF